MPLPPGLLIEAGFHSTARTPISATRWTDITDRALAFSCNRGRANYTSTCEPGEASVVLLNPDGLFDNLNRMSKYSGKIVANTRVRISALDNEGVRHYLSTTYADSWTRTWPGGFAHSLCEFTGTDRFKLLASRQNTGATSQEQADVRIRNILDNGLPDNPDSIIGSDDYQINADASACRVLVPHIYSAANTLENLKEIANSDGGAMFMDGAGEFIFQSTRFRADNPRALTSQATFGNAYTATVPLDGTNPPTLLNDDVRLANVIRITDGTGVERVAIDQSSIDLYDRKEMDLGGTLLAPADAIDRANDVLIRHAHPNPRYETLTIDCYGSNAALQQALHREISDRITVAYVPRGQQSGTTQDYYIEGISHQVNITSWKTTFRLTATGVSTQIGTTTPVAPTIANTTPVVASSTATSFDATFPTAPPAGSTILVGVHSSITKQVTSIEGMGARWTQVAEKKHGGVAHQVWMGIGETSGTTFTVKTSSGSSTVGIQAIAAQKPLFPLKKPESEIPGGTVIPVTAGSASAGEFIFSITTGQFDGATPGSPPTFTDTPSAWSGQARNYFGTNIAASIEFTTVPTQNSNWQRTYTYPVALTLAMNTKVVLSG